MGYRRYILRLASCILHPASCILTICLMLAVQACAPVAAPVPTPAVNIAPTATPTASATLPPLDAEAIAARLTPVATVSQAAGQLAAVLGTTPDAVRVRVEAPPVGACAACDRPPVGEPEEGVPVGDGALPLAPASAVWLTVRNVVCHYVYDGQELKPISVRLRSPGVEP
ncbi:MAG: hypothetical protein QHJ81_11175 [Anaerolineae bacterium]|nr:hypothetical protein [Anaerolineae bacterium]